MGRGWAIWVGGVALALPASAQDADEPPILRVGEAVQGEITEFDPEVFTEVLERDYGDASVVGKLYMVQVEETGPYHIDLKSYDFDAYLILRNDFGEVLIEDDDGFVLSSGPFQ